MESSDYVVVWSGVLEKQRHDQQVRPAPPIREESRPRMCREKSVDVDRFTVREFRVADERVIRSLRRKWGIGL
jgi:hypothetical protein